MKEKIYKKVQRMDEFITDIVCNMCGKSCKVDECDKSVFASAGSAYISFGYGSNFDGNDYALDICDGCFEKFLEKLKLQPEIL